MLECPRSDAARAWPPLPPPNAPPPLVPPPRAGAVIALRRSPRAHAQVRPAATARRAAVADGTLRRTGAIACGAAVAHPALRRTHAVAGAGPRGVVQCGAVAQACAAERALAAPELLARLRRLAIGAAVFFAGDRIAVRHRPAMIDVVRPVAVADVGAVEIVVPVDVDVHVVVVPVPAAPQRRARGDAGAPEESVDERGVRHRPVRRVVRRVRGPPPTSVHDRRLVGRHVDDLRIRRLDHDVGLRPFLLHLDLLLLVALQISGGLGLRAQVLHGVHHLRLLREERVAQLLRPGEVLVHPVQHLGEGGQRLDALVPRLVLQRILERRALQPGVLLAPARGLDDLERIRRRHQHLRQQRIGVERDRGQHRVEFLLLEGRSGRGGLRARRRGWRRGRRVLRRGCGRKPERNGDGERGERAVSHRASPVPRELMRMLCCDDMAPASLYRPCHARGSVSASQRRFAIARALRASQLTAPIAPTKSQWYRLDGILH